MRVIILCFLAFVSVAMKAQQRKDVKVIAQSMGMWSSTPKAIVDKKTKKKTAVWDDTENNSWHDDMGMIEDVPVVNDINNVFPDLPALSVSTDNAFAPMLWQLTEEGDETVLHCYLRMPAEIVKNLWLCSDECVILDKETGVIYQSRRTIPDCYSKVFSVKGKEGTFLDFQIFFPKLADTTKEIAIYGVPNWYMRGMDVTLNKKEFAGTLEFIDYDAPPQFYTPHLVSEAKNYNKDNYQSWAVYDDAHLIKPVEDGTYALWLTPDATYLAEACEMNWNREYFGRGGDNILVDHLGHQYKCKDVLGYPNNDLFWNEGKSGDYFAIVCVFEPLPLNIKDVTLIVPEGEPFAMWGANWSGKVQPLNIKELRQNQRLFEYHSREVVK